jgi:hypothetical protein
VNNSRSLLRELDDGFELSKLSVLETACSSVQKSWTVLPSGHYQFTRGAAIAIDPASVDGRPRQEGDPA